MGAGRAEGAGRSEVAEKAAARPERCAGRRPERRLVPIPGVFYGGGCSYMACRGLMMGGIEDVLLVTHGPVGCAYFAGINGYRGADDDWRQRHTGRTFVTHMNETDVVFGAEAKLARAIDEAVALYAPRAIAVCATCPVGLIGDDIETVCAEASACHGIDILSLSCEGFKERPGWLLAGERIMGEWVGRGDGPAAGGGPAGGAASGDVGNPFTLHFMSESYEAERKVAIGALLRSAGYDVVCSMMGSTTYEQITRCQRARLVALDSGKQIDAVPRMFQERYGCGFMRVHLCGVGSTAASLRAMAAFFGDEGLAARTEQVVAAEIERVYEGLAAARRRYEGTVVAVFEDIFRSNDYATLSGELGMDVVMVSQDYGARRYTDQGYTVHLPAALVGRLPDSIAAAFGGGVEGAAGKESAAESAAEGVEAGGAEGGRVEAGRAESGGAARTVASLPGCPHLHCPGRDLAWIPAVLDARSVSGLLDALRPAIAFAGIEERFGYAEATVRSELFSSDVRGCDYTGFDAPLQFARDIEAAANVSRWYHDVPAWAVDGADEPGGPNESDATNPKGAEVR